MAREKKVRERVNWRRELHLAPGYIILSLWVLFTFILLGWVIAASFSTSKEIFSGGVFRFESGFHLENYAKAWNTSNVSVYKFPYLCVVFLCTANCYLCTSSLCVVPFYICGQSFGSKWLCSCHGRSGNNDCASALWIGSRMEYPECHTG